MGAAGLGCGGLAFAGVLRFGTLPYAWPGRSAEAAPNVPCGGNPWRRPHILRGSLGPCLLWGFGRGPEGTFTAGVCLTAAERAADGLSRPPS